MGKLGVCTTIPGREALLRTMLESVASQLDEVRVLACGGVDPEKIGPLPGNVVVEYSPDRMTVEARFGLVRDWLGLVFTLDDDVTYSDSYTEYLAHYAECKPYPVGLHGQRFERGPLTRYVPSQMPGWAHYAKPTMGGWAMQLGFGWGCWDTRTFTVPKLQPLGNDDAQIAVWCQANSVPMLVVPHEGNLSLVQDTNPVGSIYEADKATGFGKRLRILKHCRRWVTHSSAEKALKPLMRPNVDVRKQSLAIKPVLVTPQGGGTVALIVAAKAGKNAETFLPECLHAAKQQKLPPGWTLDIRIGTDACIETSAVLEQMNQPHWRSFAHIGAYVMRNSLIALAPADVYAVFDCDDTMKPGYLEWACHAYPDKIVGASREEKGIRRPWVHGVASFGSEAWAKLGGYRDWMCLADSDIIRRAESLAIPRHRSMPPLYLRRLHPASLIHSKDMGIGSAHRNARQKEIERGIRARDFVVKQPVTAPLEYVSCLKAQTVLL